MSRDSDRASCPATRASSLLLVGVVAVGCAGPGLSETDGEGGASSSGGAAGEGGAAPLCEATDFGAAVDHELPGDYPPEAFDGLGSAGDCDAGSALPSYGLVDLDGDALVDLVVTDNCVDPAVGEARWLFYRNDGTAFGPAAPWSLPDYGPEAFEHLAGAGSCGSGDLKPSYGLTDLDGDGLIELVVADDCIDGDVGRTTWRVHRNTGAGFAAASESWGLPDYGPEAFEHLAGPGACGDGDLEPAYALLDLDGDRELDLVITDNCYSESLGRDHWLVYVGSGAGFAPTGSEWGLPEYGPDAFDQVSASGACAGGKLEPAFGLADLDGDHAVDLVVTDDCVDESVGRTRWLWHANTGAAFAAAPVGWSLPEYGPEAFEHISGAGSCSGGELKPAYGLIDLTGDEQLELVVTDDCVDEALGRSRWRAHAKSGNGFGASPAAFGLPDYGPEPFEHLAGAGPCSAELKPTYGLVDLDGEGHLDLVVTDECTDETIGHTRWLRHDGRCN